MSIKDSIIDALKEEHMKRRWRVEQIAPAQAHASGHRSVSPNDFRIPQKGYNNNKVKRKISEALLIRKHRTSLNIHENSVALSVELFGRNPLELFNWCPRTIIC